MDRPFVSDVEDFVTHFVQSANGQRVTDFLSYAPDFENADFIFKAENVLIELKCLERDIFSDEDIDRNEALLDKWLSEGVLKKVDIIPILLRRKPIPDECLIEIIKLARKTFQRVIEKANKQLQSTKEKIGMLTTQKVLMVCNDGNYFFENAVLFALLCDIVATRKEIDLDCVVYFTVNQASHISNSELDWAIWAPAYGERAGEDLQTFINDLGAKFNIFYNTHFGIEVTAHREIPELAEGAKALHDMRYIPKDVIYKK
jgi:hypothetical protein